eukprot:1152788-Pelagomonas_calceolata.AAC.5
MQVTSTGDQHATHAATSDEPRAFHAGDQTVPHALASFQWQHHATLSSVTSHGHAAPGTLKSKTRSLGAYWCWVCAGPHTPSCTARCPAPLHANPFNLACDMHSSLTHLRAGGLHCLHDLAAAPLICVPCPIARPVAAHSSSSSMVGDMHCPITVGRNVAIRISGGGGSCCCWCGRSGDSGCCCCCCCGSAQLRWLPWVGQCALHSSAATADALLPVLKPTAPPVRNKQTASGQSFLECSLRNLCQKQEDKSGRFWTSCVIPIRNLLFSEPSTRGWAWGQWLFKGVTTFREHLKAVLGHFIMDIGNPALAHNTVKAPKLKRCRGEDAQTPLDFQSSDNPLNRQVPHPHQSNTSPGGMCASPHML